MAEDRRIHVRDAQPRDAAAVAAMCNDLNVLTGMEAAEMTAEAVVRDLIGGHGLGLIVAELDGRLAGYALFHLSYETAYAARGLFICDLYVLQPARRHGVGRALMEHLARRSAADGGRYLWWVVNPDNDRATAFYDTVGDFVEDIKARAVFDASFDCLVRGRGEGG